MLDIIFTGEAIMLLTGLTIVDDIFLIPLIRKRSLLENNIKKNDRNTMVIIVMFFNILEV
tara:strand:- start:968 stop:1147 length:180 start_codon:yes stop_codon:yes gene_type:complete